MYQPHVLLCETLLVQFKGLELRFEEHLPFPRLRNLWLVWYSDLLLPADHARPSDRPVDPIPWNAVSTIQSMLSIPGQQRRTFGLPGMGTHHWLVLLARCYPLLFSCHAFLLISSRKTQNQE